MKRSDRDRVISLAVLGSLLATVISVTTLMGATGVSASPGPLSSKPVLVSMGDSFASGEANPPFDRGTNDVPLLVIGRKNLCHRSAASAARLLGATSTTQIACSGAVIDDVVARGKWSNGAPDDRSQIDQLKDLARSRSIDAVTISIGGNDLDFGGVVTKCFDQITGGCLGDLDVRLRKIDAVTTRLRDVVYPAIRQVVGTKVPILVVGYPRLFPADDRPAVKCGWLSTEERRRANQLQDRFDASTAAAVRESSAQNIKYVSMLDTSAGHELCTQDSWFYPVSTACNPGQFETGVKAYCAHPLASLQYAMALRLLGWTPRHFDASKLGCGSDCKVTGQIMFKHPAWGFATLVTTVHGDRYPSLGSLHDAVFVVVDRNDQIRYRSRSLVGIAMQWSGSSSEGFAPAQSFPDAARSNDDGNLFMTYNPGRYDGLIVLRPTLTGFEDFGSIPNPNSTSGAFYYVEVARLKTSAAIIQTANDCNPSCAGGQITRTILQWYGGSYVAVPKPDRATRLCASVIPHATFPSPDPAVFQSTVSCSEVVRLINSRPRDQYNSTYLSSGYVCFRERAPGDSGGWDHQCADGFRVVSFFAV